MPTPTFSVSTEIRAAPETVFAYVSDLSKHGEWAANALRVEPRDNTPLRVGKKYDSTATVGGREFHAALQITAYDPPRVFSFSGSDETGTFSHRFTFEPVENRTRVTRTVSFDLSLPQYAFYLLALNRVRLPAAHKALQRLREQVEKEQG